MDLLRIAARVASAYDLKIRNPINMAVYQKVSEDSGKDMLEVMTSLSEHQDVHDAISDVVNDIASAQVSVDDVIDFINGISSTKTKSLGHLKKSVDSFVNEMKSRVASSPLTERPDYGKDGASVPRGERTAILKQRYREDTDQTEYALVSKKKNPKTGKRRILQWFGPRKPSDEKVAEVERRIQYFKHHT